VKIRHEESKWTKITMSANEFREKLDLPPGMLVLVHVWGREVEITLSNKEES
jgi:hypothetical protein